MYGYIYLTTNLVNGRKYVGKHKSPVFDPNYKGSGKLLWRAINKYGWDNFKTELLIECESLESLNQAEIDEIKSRDAIISDEYYNLNGGGEGWEAFWQSPDFIKMMTDMMSGDNNPAKRLDVRDKMRGPRPCIMGESNPNYGGKSVTPNQRKRQADYCREHYKGENNPMYGKHHSEESKRSMSETRRGTRVINNGTKEVHVKGDRLNELLSQGYTYGGLSRKK